MLAPDTEEVAAQSEHHQDIAVAHGRRMADQAGKRIRFLFSRHALGRMRGAGLQVGVEFLELVDQHDQRAAGRKLGLRDPMQSIVRSIGGKLLRMISC